MGKHRNPGSITVRIDGDVSGQVAAGDHIRQHHHSAGAAPPPEADLAALRDLIDELRRTVATQAPEEQRDAALERVDELAEAVVANDPDLGTMNSVRNWFARTLPQLAGAVYGVIISPVVAKVVEAAGEEAATGFHGLFG